MKRLSWTVAVALMFSSFSISVLATPAGSEDRPANRLCTALANIQDGDQLPVVFEGILSAYFELHDPAELRCAQEIQSWTLVAISPELDKFEDLQRLLKNDRGAYVRLSGELLGPERGGADNPQLPVGIATGARFHGLHGPMASRTKLVVKAIERLQPLSDVAFERPPGRQLPSPFPEVIKAEMPTEYPRHAHKLGLSGQVLAQITILQGKVAAVEILEGDRTLVAETEATIRTWQFAPATEARFTTTFSYRIENVPAGAAKVDVRAQLPLLVEVSAPRHDW